MTGEGEESFRVGPVKLFADGVWSPACDGHINGQRVRTGQVLPGLDEDMCRAFERASASPFTPPTTSAYTKL